MRALLDGVEAKGSLCRIQFCICTRTSRNHPYQAEFTNKRKGGHLLYYGASISAWHKLFIQHGYRFVGIESNGVDTLFVNPELVSLPEKLVGPSFRDTLVQYARYGGWEKQFALIKDRTFVTFNWYDKDGSSDNSCVFE